MFAIFGLAAASPLGPPLIRDEDISQARFKREQCYIFNNNNNNGK